MYCAPMLRTQELGGLGVQRAAGGCLVDEDLDSGHEVSPALATLAKHLSMLDSCRYSRVILPAVPTGGKYSPGGQKPGE